MNREMQIILEVNNQADICYEDAVKLGEHAATALRKTHRAQLTGLETIAESTSKTSDVFDYIKKQTARNSFWRQTHQDSASEGFGARLKKYLEIDLKKRAEIICNNQRDTGDKSEEDKQREIRRIHLLLMRQFIRHMVVEYEFKVNLGDTLNRSGNQGKDGQKQQGNKGKGS
jgi:hypothetical protein